MSWGGTELVEGRAALDDADWVALGAIEDDAEYYARFAEPLRPRHQPRALSESVLRPSAGRIGPISQDSGRRGQRAPDEAVELRGSGRAARRAATGRGVSSAGRSGSARRKRTTSAARVIAPGGRPGARRPAPARRRPSAGGPAGAAVTASDGNGHSRPASSAGSSPVSAPRTTASDAVAGADRRGWPGASTCRAAARPCAGWPCACGRPAARRSTGAARVTTATHHAPSHAPVAGRRPMSWAALRSSSRPTSRYPSPSTRQVAGRDHPRQRRAHRAGRRCRTARRRRRASAPGAPAAPGRGGPTARASGR